MKFFYEAAEQTGTVEADTYEEAFAKLIPVLETLPYKGNDRWKVSMVHIVDYLDDGDALGRHHPFGKPDHIIVVDVWDEKEERTAGFFALWKEKKDECD